MGSIIDLNLLGNDYWRIKRCTMIKQTVPESLNDRRKQDRRFNMCYTANK